MNSRIEFDLLPRGPFTREWPRLYVSDWPTHEQGERHDASAAIDAAGEDALVSRQPNGMPAGRPADDGFRQVLSRFQDRPKWICDPREAWRMITILKDSRFPSPDICVNLLSYECKTWTHPRELLDESEHEVGFHKVSASLMRALPEHLNSVGSLGNSVLLYSDGLADFARSAVSGTRQITRLNPRSGIFEYLTEEGWMCITQKELAPFDTFISGCDWYDPESGLAFSDTPLLGRCVLAMLHDSGHLDSATRRVLVASPDQAKPGTSRHCHIAAQHLINSDGAHRFPNIPKLVYGGPVYLRPMFAEEYDRHVGGRGDWLAMIAADGPDRSSMAESV